LDLRRLLLDLNLLLELSEDRLLGVPLRHADNAYCWIGTIDHAAIARNAPLSMAATLAIVRAARADRDLRAAIAREFRFTARAIAQGEFLEGVRAQVIDKDRAPRWRHAGPGAVDPAEVAAMLAPLGPEWRIWEDIA
ncbi:MAG: enoyl-CoA hydratase/isomerase family protein, partial [Gemmobacter sp.]